MNNADIKGRINKIFKNLKADELDAVVLTSGANVRYVTGFSGDDSWAVVIGRKVWLVTDSRYTEQAQGECAGCRIVERKGGIVDAVVGVVGKCKRVERLGVEYRTSLRDFEELKKKLNRVRKVRVSQASGVVSKVRMVKDEFEVSAIRKAAKIAKRAIGGALGELRVGMAECELAGLIEFNMRKLGSSASFDTIVAFGANGSMPHYVPAKRKLRKNDTILIDFGARFEGYCSDMTRCFGVGKVKGEYLRAYDAVKRAQAAAIKAVSAGVKIADVAGAARKVIEEAGLPQYGHGTGHGLGLEVHELPTVSRRNDAVLEAGQVITIEPGVYLPGEFGIRVEDDVLVTKDGCEILTRGKRSPELEILER